MPKYRIVSETDSFPDLHAPRGAELRGEDARLVTYIDAGSLAEATVDARDTQPHSYRRIISVEEIHPGFSYTDQQLTFMLAGAHPSEAGTGEPLVDPDNFAGETEPLAASNEFRDVVGQVVCGLRESGLVPGLDISVLDNEPDEPYAMVEVHDVARGVYLSRGTELRRLTDDSDAAGWQGVLAIARELIAFSNDLH